MLVFVTQRNLCPSCLVTHKGTLWHSSQRVSMYVPVC